MTYRELLDTATEDITNRLGLTKPLADKIGLRDMIRTIYAASSNAQAITEVPEFATEIFLAACLAGGTRICNIISRNTQGSFPYLPSEVKSILVEVIGDLFNE